MITCVRRTGCACGLASALSLLSACDCYREVSAVVLDSSTMLPLKGVIVRERQRGGQYQEERLATDALGRFDFSDVSGGFACPPVHLHFATEGYIPADVEFNPGTDADTVLLRMESQQ